MTTPLGGNLLGAALAPEGVRSLACPSCGAAVVLRGLGWTQTVACAHCEAVLDAADPNLAVLQDAARRAGPAPAIPLGSRGPWRGADHEVIGYQERAITADGETYAWREYVLFNPYRGFRYLVEYDGHWTDVVPLAALPVPATEGGRPAVRLGDRVYRHFQTATARTRRVLGEFPWEARTGDEAESRDYVAPPVVLSAEEDAGETTWSRGEYVDGRAVWAAFQLPGRPPAARGVYANQPSPHAGAGSLMPLFAAFVLLLVLGALARYGTARNAVAFHQTYTYTPQADDAGGADVTGIAASSAAGPTASQAFVTPAFALEGRWGLPTTVVLETTAPLNNEWMGVEYALVDEATGRAFETAREVSYYTGRDSDGAWSEGSRRDRVRLGPVPPGRYFLRAEPTGGVTGPNALPITWTLTVRRDVPSALPFVLALVALAVPPGLAALRAAGFEHERWQQSDYAVTASDDEDEE